MSDLSAIGQCKNLFKQLYRYAIVGILNNLAGYLVYLFITYIGATPKLTMTVLYAIGATIGYFGNRNFTFSYKGSFIGTGARYCIAHFFGYLINLTLLIVFVDKLGYAHQWVQAAAIGVVACFLFIAFKFFVFTNSSVSTVSKL